MLAAAAEAIDEKGFGDFTVAEVITRAKVSRKTFYDVFEDREACFVALLDEVIAVVGARMSAVYASQSNWRESMRAGLTELLAFIDEDPLLARVCVVEVLAAGRRALERRAEVLEQLTEVIDRGRSLTAGSEPAGLVAEGVLGGVFVVIHGRLLERSSEPFIGLIGSLMSMIVLPYLGARAASRELSRPAPQPPLGKRPPGGLAADPLEGMSMRLTYRTMRVLSAIKERPGSSNREVGEAAEVADPGQTSRLVARLERLQLIENRGNGRAKGRTNEWHLTERGKRVERVMHVSAA